jgi:uncharacterized protein (DUF488 family)
MKLFTIGFSGKNAKTFFELLKKNGVRTLIDIRLNNKSQLAGFTKAGDIPYFLEEICNIKYIHHELLAPTKDLLDGYKSGEITWQEYEIEFNRILESREILKNINFESLDNSCFLCSEALPKQCHRRLLAEYVQKNLYTQNIEITHL